VPAKTLSNPRPCPNGASKMTDAQTSTKKQIRATFKPQVWIGDYANDADPEGPTEWAATPDVLRCSLEQIHKLIDCDYSTDDFSKAPSAPDWIKNWSGPFEVEIASSVLEFFGVESLHAITAEMLTAARSAYLDLGSVADRQDVAPKNDLDQALDLLEEIAQDYETLSPAVRNGAILERVNALLTRLR
jgi:hypothetical protein